jgi:hypothetical protein
MCTHSTFFGQSRAQDTGEISPTSIDTEAGWSKSGWHGWWYGWTPPLAVSVGAVWSLLAAELNPAHTADNAVAPRLLAPLLAGVRYGLEDTAYHDPAVRWRCEQANRALVATRRGVYPHHDEGVEVRRSFHQLRSQAIEPFNGLFKNVFDWRTQLPVKGLRRSQRLALGAMVVSQLVLRGVALSTRAQPPPWPWHEAPVEGSMIDDHASLN